MKRLFRSQLDLISVLKLSATIGFGSGIFIGLVFLFVAIQNGQTAQGIKILVFFPPLSVLGNATTGLIGYPFYAWYCDRIKGQHIQGKFAEMTPADSTNQQEED